MAQRHPQNRPVRPLVNGPGEEAPIEQHLSTLFRPGDSETIRDNPHITDSSPCNNPEATQSHAAADPSQYSNTVMIRPIMISDAQPVDF
jgi:hypothetical protein